MRVSEGCPHPPPGHYTLLNLGDRVSSNAHYNYLDGFAHSVLCVQTNGKYQTTFSATI
jgi:hypothetical protein